MNKYNTNQFRAGIKLLIKNIPYSIIDNNFVKPGKGQAFHRVKLRNLKNNKVIEKTFKSGETVEKADITELEMQYIYNDGKLWYFMDIKTYEQYEVKKEFIIDTILWIQAQDICIVSLWNGNILSVEPPNFVILQINETSPVVRSDTTGSSGKNAILENGVILRVPLFMQNKEFIKVDTRTKEYISRIKK